MKHLLIALTLLSITGCAAGIKTETSPVTGNTSIYNDTPAYIYRKAGGFSGYDIIMNAFWTSATPENVMVMLYTPASAGSGQAIHLTLNLDGKTIRHDGQARDYDVITYNSGVWSGTKFTIARSEIQQWIDADSVFIRYNNGSGWAEGEISDTTINSAKNTLSKIIEAINARD